MAEHAKYSAISISTTKSHSNGNWSPNLEDRSRRISSKIGVNMVDAVDGSDLRRAFFNFGYLNSRNYKNKEVSKPTDAKQNVHVAVRQRAVMVAGIKDEEWTTPMRGNYSFNQWYEVESKENTNSDANTMIATLL
ncbi:Uncharacterized protein Fot_41849 [Forsythia ovata]|uniref:Uncharacterized protein n=1 Tax=Forsythia ovata TaxID=205694 RepID=A0ABD1RKZ5_9LAMI